MPADKARHYRLLESPQAELFAEPIRWSPPPPLLKWIGSKRRVAVALVEYFPSDFRMYYEPFLGSGAVLGTLAPRKGVGSDILEPLIEIWQTLAENPNKLPGWYQCRWEEFQKDRVTAYKRIRAGFNRRANSADLLFLCRSCYGGVIRFRKDGYMSTPIGAHNPIPPEEMGRRVRIWRERTKGVRFWCCDFEETMDRAKAGDLIYCDPPYSETQSILYGAQQFSLDRLFRAIEQAKRRGAFVALSIDGQKKSGKRICDVPIPRGLFARVALIHGGRSMLRRFQMEGKSLESEVVADRLALTW